MEKWIYFGIGVVCGVGGTLGTQETVKLIKEKQAEKKDEKAAEEKKDEKK